MELELTGFAHRQCKALSYSSDPSTFNVECAPAKSQASHIYSLIELGARCGLFRGDVLVIRFYPDTAHLSLGPASSTDEPGLDDSLHHGRRITRSISASHSARASFLYFNVTQVADDGF